MAEAFAIAASVIALVNTSRKAVKGITKLAELRHAPEILLALNNEVMDLQFVIVRLSIWRRSDLVWHLLCRPRARLDYLSRRDR